MASELMSPTLPLENILQPLGLELPTQAIDLESYEDVNRMFDRPLAERLGAALRVFIGTLQASGFVVEKMDRSVIEAMVAWLDARISQQVNEVIHHPDFTSLEQSWRSLKYLSDRSDRSRNVRLEILQCSLEDLAEDLDDSPSVQQSGLYKHVYADEYDMPGGEPYGAMVADWQFSCTEKDIDVLSGISKIAAAAHCPFLSSVGPDFFGKQDMRDLMRIDDLEHFMERAELTRWKSFRESEDSRYVGMILPRFLLRTPWDTRRDKGKTFSFVEETNALHNKGFLWGNAVFAFAANMVRSFQDNGWCVQIRGPESGGRVGELPIHLYDAGRGLETLMPTEILIPETRECEFAKQGFIPLSYYKNRDYACFFSAASVQKPKEFNDSILTANARINARLPYMFLSSRIAHYLKVLQRETIGAAKSPDELEQQLNGWLKGLVTQMKNPGAALISTHPLSFAEVKVYPSEDNPGYYHVNLRLVPHFQVEGVDANLSLVSQMPAAT